MPDKPNQQGRQTTFRESDGRIVPYPAEGQSVREKPSNAGVGKAARPLRDPDQTPPVLSDGISVLTRLDRIHQRAESQPEAVFNNLFSLLNVQLLWHAFRRMKRGKAPGVDHVTLEDYEQNLRGNLQDLLRRLHRGSYRPHPACVRTFPKGMGKRVRWVSLAWKTSSSNALSS